MCFGELASTPVFQGVIAENTCIYVQYTCIYVIYIHIHAYTLIYVHICIDMCRYVHIRSFSYLSQIAVGRCFGGEAADVFWQQCEILSSRSAFMDHETGSPSLDMAWGTSLQSRGGAKVAWGAFSGGEGGGARKIGCAKVSPPTEKNACPDALGCPEWGPLAAVHRECVLGSWHQLPCFRGS